MKIQILITDDAGKMHKGTLIFDKGVAVQTKVNTKNQKKIPKKVMPAHIIERELYEHHFFKTEKNLTEVFQRLDGLGYHFKKGSILMVLKAAKYLIKNGKKGNYKFVQRHPFKEVL